VNFIKNCNSYSRKTFIFLVIYPHDNRRAIGGGKLGKLFSGDDSDGPFQVAFKGILFLSQGCVGQWKRCCPVVRFL
jgi:hypothetical protein